MIVVYVAGPFRPKEENNCWEMEQNIRRAEALALEGWQKGYAVVCPHANTRFYQGSADDDVWLKGDLEILSRCDCLLAVEGWENSSGTITEINWAFHHDYPVFYSWEELDKWALEFEGD